MNRDPFKGVSPPETVINELEARADISNMIKWAAKRVPWIHVMSMAAGCSRNYSPLGNGNGNVFELFGTSNSSALYGVGSKFPLPVITGIDVGALGNLGTTRMATLKIKAYTDEHLVELQKCYFIPGMDVRVQFGWSESCNKTPPPAVYVEIVSRQKDVCEIASRAAGNAAYDGFQGIVANFSYSLQSDNTWDCSIEINSAADAFAESTIEDTKCGCAREMKMTNDEGRDETVTAKYGRLYTMLYDIFTDASNARQYVGKLQKNANAGSKDLQNCIGWSSYFYWGMARTQDGKDDSGWLEGTILGKHNTIEQFVTWGMLEAAINAYTLPNTAGLPYGRVDSSGITLPAADPKMMSSDPRVCIIPNQEPLAQYRGGQPSGGTAASIGTSMLVPMEGSINLCDIELNVVFLMMELKKVFDGDKKMSTFLRAVIDKVNDVCGNPWNIEIVCSSDTANGCEQSSGGDGGAISIVDLKQFNGNEFYEIQASAKSSAVRNISFEMKMTGAMKTQALYAGGTQQGGTSSKDGGDATGCKGLSFEPFYVGGGKNRAMPRAVPSEKDKAECDCDKISHPKVKAPPTFDKLINTCKNDLNDNTVQGVRNKLIDLIQGPAKPAHCAGVMLPFDFSFECDGIGGFRFAQLISCNRIPPAIKSKMIWQITKVDHSITANDWITKVSTVCRLKQP